MLSTNLDPVICTVTVDDNPLSVLFASVLPDIESQARELAERVYSFHLETSDLCQEALAAIWKNREKFTALSQIHQTRLALRISLCSMINYVKREFKQIPTRSLDAWQCVEREDGIMHREIAEQPRVYPITPDTTRNRIHTALRALSNVDRDVILSSFAIDPTGKKPCLTPEQVMKRHKITPNAYRVRKSRAMKRLALALS